MTMLPLERRPWKTTTRKCYKTDKHQALFTETLFFIMAICLTDLVFRCRIEYDPINGKYDLRIENATYNRDNGQYECRMKKEGSGEQLHTKSLVLTVLLKPSVPVITPSNPTATEGRPLNFTCSSVGGSPPPQIYWYREGQAQLLEATLMKGKNKDEPTKSVLTVMPTKETDGSTYRCTVWNRALRQRQKLETSTRLNVNCK